MPRNTCIFFGMPTRWHPKCEAWLAACACATATTNAGHKVYLKMMRREPATIARNEVVRQFFNSDAM